MSLKKISLNEDFDEFIGENKYERMVFIVFHPPEEECNPNVLTKLYEISEKDQYEAVLFAQVDLSLDWAQEYLVKSLVEPETFYVNIYLGKCFKVPFLK